MAVTIAEYLGQRVDHQQSILPLGDNAPTAICPFMNHLCSKTSKNEGSKPPVCALRKKAETFYIVCEDRLLSTKVAALSPYQRTMLLNISQALFIAHLHPDQVGYKAEVKIRTGESNQKWHMADFVLALLDSQVHTLGPRKLIVEVQGGGETNNTGSITRHIDRWERLKSPDNTYLARTISGAGTIETNAWRRLQEQIFVKATTALKTNEQYGFAAVLGEVVFDYITDVVPTIRSYRRDPRTEQWNLAFIVFKEDKQNTASPVPLVIDEERTTYMLKNDLFDLLTDRGRKDENPFVGQFTTLSGQTVDVTD